MNTRTLPSNCNRISMPLRVCRGADSRVAFLAAVSPNLEKHTEAMGISVQLPKQLMAAARSRFRNRQIRTQRNDPIQPRDYTNR